MSQVKDSCVASSFSLPYERLLDKVKPTVSFRIVHTMIPKILAHTIRQDAEPIVLHARDSGVGFDITLKHDVSLNTLIRLAHDLEQIFSTVLNDNGVKTDPS